ncbi:MAG: hypothetical protein IH851_13145 [Armatimonadetes bacterium]|nr:hypothetical protein [Armatimonadota bacterium]
MNDRHEEIHAYLDNELDDDGRRSVERSLAQSEELRAYYLAAQRVKSALAEKAKRFECDDVWERCRTRLREVDRANRTESLVFRFRFAATAMVALAILSGAILNRINPGPDIDANSLARIASASPGSLLGFNSRSESLAADWLGEQLGRPVQTPSVRSADLYLICADIVQSPECTVGRFIYTDGETDYLLLFVPDNVGVCGTPIPGERQFFEAQVGGLNAIWWRHDGRIWVFLAPKPVSTLLRIVER